MTEIAENHSTQPAAADTTNEAAKDNIIPEGKIDENKVEESLERGNKSYYFWSKNIDHQQLGVVQPKLLEKKVAEVLPTRTQVTITSYYWDEEKQFVKIYIPLEGIGNHSPENIKSHFTDDSFDLTILDFKDQDLRFGLPNLFARIDPKESKHRVLPNKIILSLKKVKEQKWGFLRPAVKP